MTDLEKIREGLKYRPEAKLRNEARQVLIKLQEWGGRIVEFLDSFEASFEDDEFAQEALALQEEGLNLGLKRVYPVAKEDEQ